MMDICRDMEKMCPKAKLFNVSNPLTKVHEAIHRYTKIDAYGFCSVAQCGSNGYEKIALTLGRDHAEIDVVSAGLNHFSWVISIKDHKTNEDLFPKYLDELYKASANNEDSKIMWEWYEQYGAVIAPPIDHASDFLPYQPNIRYYDSPPFHGSESERLQRIEEMKRMASGELDYRSVSYFLGVTWEHPGLVIGAISNKTDYHINCLNIPNDGYLPQLPEGAIVEVPADIRNGCIQAFKGITLPNKTVEVCLNQSQVAAMIAKAAVEGDKELVPKIIDTDIALVDKAAAKRAIKRMISAHADIL
jgi:alpha-galactosidase